MIIAFSGKSQAGKTTAADFLCSNFGFTRLSFARSLKLKLQADFEFSDAQVFDAAKDTVDPRYGVTPREILIAVANLYRSFDPDFWVKKSLTNLDPSKNYVIDDLRFQNEADHIARLGGTLIRLVREGVEAKVASAAADISETELDTYPFEHVIRANTVEDGQGCLMCVLTQLGINATMAIDSDIRKDLNVI
jgi:hypothetical protein